MVLFRDIACRWSKFVVLVQIGCIRARWLYSGNIWLYIGKSGSYRTKLLYFGKLVVIRQNWLFLGI